MTDLWTFENATWIDEGMDRHGEGVLPDIVGYDVVTIDRPIGRVDAASFVSHGSYVVVDTGWWLVARKRIVPAWFVQQINTADRTVLVSTSKDEINSAPVLESHVDDEEYRRALADHYLARVH